MSRLCFPIPQSEHSEYFEYSHRLCICCAGSLAKLHQGCAVDCNCFCNLREGMQLQMFRWTIESCLHVMPVAQHTCFGLLFQTSLCMGIPCLLSSHLTLRNPWLEQVWHDNSIQRLSPTPLTMNVHCHAPACCCTVWHGTKVG